MKSSEKGTLQELLQQEKLGLSESQIDHVISYYQALMDANQEQNLTRLVSHEDFVSGNLFDVTELIRTGWLGGRVLDLGSGGGIPGLLTALIEGNRRQWILSESERRKAEFLSSIVHRFDLSTYVSVIPDRAESYLLSHSVTDIVVRAVANISKLYTWLKGCSTWNSLILFKGPSWDEEWAAFSKTRFRYDLKIQEIVSYTVGIEEKQRVLIRLVRK